MADKYVSQALTNVAIRYHQNQDKFIAGRVFPEVGVPKQGGHYWIYDKGAWFRTETEERAPGTETPEAKWGATKGNYYCMPKGVHSNLTDQDRANYDSIFAGDQTHTELVMSNNLLKREIEWGQKYFVENTWTGTANGADATPSTKFDVSGSTPIDYVGGKLDEMEEKTGFRPNKLVTGRDVYTVLKNHAQIIGRLGDAQTKMATLKIIASLLDVEEYLVASATNETGIEGGTSNMQFLFKKHMWLGYAAKNPSLEVPSAGYTINWKGYLKGSGFMRMKKYRMENLESDRIEGMMAYDQKLTAADLGIFIKNAIS